jgi:hypothetical protein
VYELLLEHFKSAKVHSESESLVVKLYRVLTMLYGHSCDLNFRQCFMPINPMFLRHDLPPYASGRRSLLWNIRMR